MSRHLLLLSGVVLLYLVPSLVLQAVYGDSYGFWSGEDCWQPDGAGGWVKHGQPDGPPPAEPSQNVPLLLHYVPIFLPAALLVVFLFTPLSRKLEKKQPPSESTGPPGDAAVDQNGDL